MFILYESHFPIYLLLLNFTLNVTYWKFIYNLYPIRALQFTWNSCYYHFYRLMDSCTSFISIFTYCCWIFHSLKRYLLKDCEHLYPIWNILLKLILLTNNLMESCTSSIFIFYLLVLNVFYSHYLLSWKVYLISSFYILHSCLVYIYLRL